MISRRFTVMACFLLPFILNNCSYLSQDLDAEGEPVATSEADTYSEELENSSEALTESQEDAIDNSVLGETSQIQVGEMPIDD